MERTQSDIKLLDIDKILKDKAPHIYRKIPRVFLSYLKRKVHQDELNEILTEYADDQGVDFMESCIKYFNLKLISHNLNKIEPSGRYIFVSNHPLGGLDGICLSAMIGKLFNGNIKYPVNDFLLHISNLQSVFVPINKHGSQSKRAANELNEAFNSDNQIITFPAGLCSRKINGKIIDPEWKKMFLTKAIETKRDIVPIFFDAYNSNFFYRFANIRKRLGIKFNLEMIFLSDEMFKNKNKTFDVFFGSPIRWQTFDESKNISGWVEYIRNIVYSLNANNKK